MPKALRRRYGYMAFNRETFKDRIEEYLRGAVIEFYKGRIATKNSRSGRSVFWTRNETRWVEHWTTEVRMLIDRFGATIGDHDIRGFKDRRKAIAEVIERLKSKDDGFLIAPLAYSVETCQMRTPPTMKALLPNPPSPAVAARFAALNGIPQKMVFA